MAPLSGKERRLCSGGGAAGFGVDCRPDYCGSRAFDYVTLGLGSGSTLSILAVCRDIPGIDSDGAVRAQAPFDALRGDAFEEAAVSRGERARACAERFDGVIGDDAVDASLAEIEMKSKGGRCGLGCFHDGTYEALKLRRLNSREGLWLHNRWGGAAMTERARARLLAAGDA